MGITMTQAAERIGVSQPYLTQLENGTEPLKSAALYKCLDGYASFGTLTIERQLELLYEMLEAVESIDIDLSRITVIHRENLLRLMAVLLLNETYISTDFGGIPWNVVSEHVVSLKKAPPKQAKWYFNQLRIVPKHVIEEGGDMNAASGINETISQNEVGRTKLEIALKLKRMGLTLVQIAEATGLSEEWVEEL